MKKEVYKLILRIIFLTLPFALMLCITEYKLRRLETSYLKKRHDFEKEAAALKVLILGSSHPLQGINPAFFNCKAYNLASASQTLYYDIALTSKYLDKLDSLKTVFISVSYFYLTEELKDLEPSREYFYYHYWNIQAGHLSRFDIRKISLVAVYTPMTSIKLAYFNYSVLGAIDGTGWQKTDSTSYSEISNEKAKARIALHEMGGRKNRNVNLNKLETFVKLLINRKIQPVFITAPVYKTYYQNINKIEFGRDSASIQKICQKYNLHYYNYFSDPAFDIHDFADNDHLNTKGAAKFSKMLSEKIHPCY